MALLKIRGGPLKAQDLQHSISVTDDSNDDTPYFRPRSISHYIPSPVATTSSSSTSNATAAAAVANHNPSPSPKPMVRPKAYSNPFAQFRRSRKTSEVFYLIYN